MTLNYRGVKYDSGDITPQAHTNNQPGIYRGVALDWNTMDSCTHRPTAAVQNRPLSMKYRGMSYAI